MFRLIGRALVTYIDNSGLTQRVQIIPLANEVCSDVERPQPYGLETYPWHMSENKDEKKFEGADSSKLAESEAVVLFQSGDRSKGLVILISDRYYRLTDLAQGEVALYTFYDKEASGHRIHLKEDGSIDIKGTELNITVTGDSNITCDTANVTATSGINLDGGNGSLTGVVTGASICPFTGKVHVDVSTDVKASK